MSVAIETGLRVHRPQNHPVGVVDAINFLSDGEDEHASTTSLALYMLLAEWCDSDGWCRVGQQKLSQALGVSSKTLRAALHSLWLVDAVESVPTTFDDGRTGPTIYRAVRPWEADL